MDNAYYLKRFAEQGKDIQPILDATGRQTRYLSDDPEENALTMAGEACKNALNSANLTGQDMDIIVFSSSTPEYLAPTNALQIHKEIGGKSDAQVYDMNANCVGMIVAVEQAARTLLASPYRRRALVVGSEQTNRFSQPNDEITTVNFGDAACAAVLEKADCAEPTGLIDAVCYTNSSNSNNALFPKTGLSHIYDPCISEEDKRLFWPGGVGDGSFQAASKLIGGLLERNGLTSQDIKRYFFSQLCLKNLNSLAAALGVGMDRVEFVGDRFGYTGTSSPFLALHHALQSGRVQQGDRVLFWSIGTGIETCALLWKL